MVINLQTAKLCSINTKIIKLSRSNAFDSFRDIVDRFYMKARAIFLRDILMIRIWFILNKNNLNQGLIIDLITEVQFLLVV